MRKLITKVSLALAGFSGVLMAQQDPQFTQFMNNKLMYNAGYAGTSGNICGVLHFRQQWASFPGAPQSFALTADMKIPNMPLGVGLNVMQDKIGPMQTLFLRIPVSYNMPLAGGTLGLGLDLGMLQKQINNTWITPDVGAIDNSIPGDYVYGNNPALNKTTYDVGFGAFFQIPRKMYVGLSSTHLPAQLLSGSGDIAFKMTRHYYLMAGYHFALDPRNEIIPNIMVRSDVNATVIDANVSYMWNQQAIAGITYRHTDAIAPMIGWQQALKNGMTVKGVYSYDYTLSKIKGYSNGSHEITLSVCKSLKVKKMASYGDERFLN
ncbi:MAG: type IX secretion system membrane protein PorP/SprF [Sphingobacteriaceae bacterium]|jgi:type IX secretion system PorP/SprF family membrane protein